MMLLFQESVHDLFFGFLLVQSERHEDGERAQHASGRRADAAIYGPQSPCCQHGHADDCQTVHLVIVMNEGEPVTINVRNRLRLRADSVLL